MPSIVHIYHTNFVNAVSLLRPVAEWENPQANEPRRQHGQACGDGPRGRQVLWRQPSWPLRRLRRRRRLLLVDVLAHGLHGVVALQVLAALEAAAGLAVERLKATCRVAIEFGDRSRRVQGATAQQPQLVLC